MLSDASGRRRTHSRARSGWVRMVLRSTAAASAKTAGPAASGPTRRACRPPRDHGPASPARPRIGRISITSWSCRSSARCAIAIRPPRPSALRPSLRDLDPPFTCLSGAEARARADVHLDLAQLAAADRTEPAEFTQSLRARGVITTYASQRLGAGPVGKFRYANSPAGAGPGRRVERGRRDRGHHPRRRAVHPRPRAAVPDQLPGLPLDRRCLAVAAPRSRSGCSQASARCPGRRTPEPITAPRA
jgi:hypothetical protein